MRLLAVLLAVGSDSIATTNAQAVDSAGSSHWSCGAGTYFWGFRAGKYHCIQCPEDTSSNGCTNCQPDPARSACKKTCPAGRFAESAVTCIACPGGKWQAEATLVDSSSCDDCAAGRFQATAGSSSCFYCPTGKYSTTERSSRCSECNQCLPGQHGFTDKPGTTSAALCFCKACPAGRYTPAGYPGVRTPTLEYTSCYECPVGKFQMDAGGLECVNCEAGKYQDAGGAPSCVSCPLGRFSPAVGATSAAQCEQHAGCPRGSYASVVSNVSITCETCTPGHFGRLVSTDVGGHCYSCPKGKFQPNAGQDDCLECPSGKFALLNSASVTCTSNDMEERYFSSYFRLYNYRYSEQLKNSGWKLLSYEEVQQYSGLILDGYQRERGFPILGPWSANGCCVTLAEGYRLTVNGRSEVFPMNAAGTGSMCQINRGKSNLYSSNQSVQLRFKDSENTNKLLDFAEATTLFGGVAQGECATTADESSPGLFMAITQGAPCRTSCVQMGDKAICPACEVAEAPTPAPTPQPTAVPTTRSPMPIATPGPTPRPVDCAVSVWGDWSNCSAVCNGGVQSRARTVVSQPSGGLPCPILSEEHNCNLAPCPVHCQYTWSPWSACSASCGSGIKTSEATVSTAAQNHGMACPVAREQSCNMDACPADCIVSDWEHLGECSKTCGSGYIVSTRQVLVKGAWGGMACPRLRDMKPCNTQVCLTGSPTAYPTSIPTKAPTAFPSAVPEECPENTYLLNAECTACPQGQYAHKGATVCKFESVDCQIKTSDWSACSTSCGAGQQLRTHSIISQPLYGGKACPLVLEMSRPCNLVTCPTDCAMASFREWSNCSETCGSGGLRTRTRSVAQQPTAGGKPCLSSVDVQPCKLQACPEDCVVSSFGEWGNCSRTCGTGYAKQSRNVTLQPRFGGRPCPPLENTKACERSPCPIDCQLSDFALWSACSTSCGNGTKSRSRSVLVAAVFDGLPCGALKQNLTCNNHSCPVDCTVSSWSLWTSCSKTCGDGEHIRTRSETRPAQFGGEACPELTDAETCTDGQCPIDCAVSGWSTYTECSKHCGTGFVTRNRTIVQEAVQGAVCPTLSAFHECNTHPCPVNCNLTAWEPWLVCSKSCGSGTQNRSRAISGEAQYGGLPCSVLMESRFCRTENCAIDCVVTEWPAWEKCTTTCGTGHQTSRRSIQREHAFGGIRCPPLSQQRSCNNFTCPVDCAVGTYSAWSECSGTCGAGVQERSRTVVRTMANGGKTCPVLLDTAKCLHPNSCDTDCTVSLWAQVGNCTKECGSGTVMFRRTIINPAGVAGRPCPSQLTKLKPCFAKECKVDCVVGPWGNWSSCSHHCGGGERIRLREIITFPADGGKLCPPLDVTKGCNAYACPCNHLSCDMVNFTHVVGNNASSSRSISGHHIRVKHHNLESNGKHHQCNWDHLTGQCRCECWHNTFFGQMHGKPAVVGELASVASIASSLLTEHHPTTAQLFGMTETADNDFGSDSGSLFG